MPKVILPNGVRIHYQQAGEGNDLVMVHGLTGNLAVWHLQMLPILTPHFRVLTYDLRGHGYSSVPATGYTPDDMADDLGQLLDALGIERAAIVGHSYGADTALYFAHHNADRTSAVVAVEAALPAMISRRSREDWPGWRYWTDVLERSGNQVPAEHRTDADYLLRQSLLVPKKWGPLQGLPRNPKPFLRLVDETTMTRDVERVGALPLAEIPQINVPVTLLYCESSAFIDTYDYLRDHLPDVRPVLLPRTEWGHFGPLEQPELVAEQVLVALGAKKSPAAPGRAARRPPQNAATRSVTRLAAAAAKGARRPGADFAPTTSTSGGPMNGERAHAVIVTGSSTGLGQEIALHLAGRGFRVYATVRDLSMAPDVEAAAQARGVHVTVLRLDLTDRASIEQAVGTVVDECGEIYGLVNNGGLGLRGCLEDLSDAEIRAVFEANVFGTIAATKAVLPHMRAVRRGRVVTISSVGGRIASFGVSAYCATKFAQEGFGEALALEVAPFGIAAVLVEPGIIETTRWSTNRATAAGALRPDSPYRALFLRGEALADRVVDRSRTTAADVAQAVHVALTVPRPRMRYVVGQPAGVVVMLRRYLPERVFERLYFGSFLRSLQRPTAGQPPPSVDTVGTPERAR